MDNYDSINAKLLSIFSFPRTPHVPLFGSNLRCGAIMKYIFANDLLGSHFPVSLSSVLHDDFKNDAVRFPLFCRSKPTSSEHP
jgi:hypothetical protein